jgi:hypothetical protein
VNELPPVFKPLEEWTRKAQIIVNQLVKGHGNNAQQSITLTAGTTTTVADQRVTSQSLPQLIPLNAGAAAITWHISSRTAGQFVITHSTAAGTEQFAYVT